jgi:hypothetical protein
VVWLPDEEQVVGAVGTNDHEAIIAL